MLFCTLQLLKALLPCVTKPWGGLLEQGCAASLGRHKPWCLPVFMHISRSPSYAEGCETCWVGVWEETGVTATHVLCSALVEHLQAAAPAAFSLLHENI